MWPSAVNKPISEDFVFQGAKRAVAFIEMKDLGRGEGVEESGRSGGFNGSKGSREEEERNTNILALKTLNERRREGREKAR